MQNVSIMQVITAETFDSNTKKPLSTRWGCETHQQDSLEFAGLLEVLIGVRFAPDTTLRYQKSAVSSTGKNQLSHGPHYCGAWVQSS
jgi:hypothetical protein